MIDMTGKIVVITGASGGIGSAMASLFEEAGSTVILTDINTPVIEHKHFRYMDVTDIPNTKKLIDEIAEEFGGINTWINNAGYLKRNSIFDLTIEDYQRTLDINLRSMIFTTQSVAKHMREKKSGSIINLSSYAGLKARPHCVDYASAKAAIHHATRSLALELGAHGIRINAIAPGYIDTIMSSWMHADKNLKDEYLARVPLGRLGMPEEIAKVALFLASDMASYITGETITVDGGLINA